MAVPFNTIPPAYPNVPFNFVSTRAAPARSPVAQRVAQSARRPVSQTVSQVANQRVNAQLNPQIAAQNAFNARQDQVIQQFANALLGKLTPVAGQIGGYYDSAINQTGALSNQAAQFLRDANPSGSVADLLRSAGAPQSQIDQQTAQLGQTFGSGAGVLSFLGGAVPGGQLAADKIAAQTQAGQYPLIAARGAQQDLASALWQQGQDMRTIQAQRPQLYQQAEQTIRENNAVRQKASAAAKQNQIDNALKVAGLSQKASQFAQTQAQKRSAAAQARKDKQAAAAQARKDKQSAAAEKKREFNVSQASKKAAQDFLNWYRTQGINQSQAKIDEKAAEFGVTSAQKNAQINISQQNANTSAVRANNTAAAATARQATADARLKVAQRHEAAYEKTQKAKQAATQKGISATTYANIRSKALKQADLYYFGKVVKDSSGQIDPDRSIPGIDYPDALKRLIDGYGLTPKDAADILKDFYAPGERRRPVHDVNPKTNPQAAGPPAP